MLYGVRPSVTMVARRPSPEGRRLRPARVARPAPGRADPARGGAPGRLAAYSPPRSLRLPGSGTNQVPPDGAPRHLHRRLRGMAPAEAAWCMLTPWAALNDVRQVTE